MTSQKGVVTAPGRSPGVAGREAGRGGRANGPGIGLGGRAVRLRLASLRICSPDCAGFRVSRPHRGPEHGDTRTGRRMRLERHGETATVRGLGSRIAALPGPTGRGPETHPPPAPREDLDPEEVGTRAPSPHWTAPAGLRRLRVGDVGYPTPAAPARLPGSTDAWASPEWSVRPANRGAGAGSGPLDIGSSYSPCLAPPVRCPR